MNLRRGVAVLENLLAAKPGHTYPRVTWQLLAACRREDGDNEGSVVALREAAAVEPVRAAALVDFARAAAREKIWLEEAEVAARDAVAMTRRQDAEALAVLADVLRYRRQYPEAMLWIKRAMAAAPDDPQWAARRRSSSGRRSGVSRASSTKIPAGTESRPGRQAGGGLEGETDQPYVRSDDS